MRLRMFLAVLLSAACLGVSLTPSLGAARAASRTVALGAAPVPAQTGADWIILRMGSIMRPDVTWEQVRSYMLAAFQQSNPDERGVTAEGIENLRLSAMAQRRAQVIAQILRYDLNGDGIVTKEEITAVMQPQARQMINANGVQLQPTPEQVRLQLDKLVSGALKPDANGDGVISAEEIRQEAERQAQDAGINWQQSIGNLVPMTLDANQDGAVSLIEYESAVREAFDSIDQDRDGRVSAAELVAFNQRHNDLRQIAQRAFLAEQRRRSMQMRVAGCDVPPAPANARLILLGAREGKALSDASVGSEDKVTTVATVEVAPGSGPLYLVLTSANAMIWDIVGATDRIVGVVAYSDETIDAKAGARIATNGPAQPPASRRSLIGVMGVPRDKVHLTAHQGCLLRATEETIKDGSAQQMVALLLGREADEIGAEQNVGIYRVPAVMHFQGTKPVRNAMPLPKTGAGEALWRDIEEEYPAGIARIDVEQVVAAYPVKRYAVLPERAGLAQLLDAGALQVAGVSHGIRINQGDYKPVTIVDKFKIMQKLRLPAEARGTFYVPRDVPMPDGDLDHACFFSEMDMKPLTEHRGAC